MESEPRPEPAGRGHLARIVATALVMLLLSVGPAGAGGGGCSALSVAKASDLLGIPGANPFEEFLSPGVHCTSEGIDPEPAVCKLRRTTTHDQMIGDERRLLVVRVTPSKGASSDYVFAFGCVDGRIQSVLHDRFHPSAKIESASLDEIMVKGSDQPGNSTDRVAFYWNGQVQAYSYAGGPVEPPAAGPEIKCADLASAAAPRLMAIPRDGFSHGVGCYSEDPIDYPSNCGWKATLKTDRMLGDSRRIIVVTDDHLGGIGSWDFLYAFGCVDGRIGVAFDDRFRYGVGIDDASPDRLTLSIAAWGPHDCESCASRVEHMTYSWNSELQSYTLESVHFISSGPAAIIPHTNARAIGSSIR